MAVPAYPENRLEQYLDAISENTEGGSSNSLPEYPENRTEQYLDAIAKNTAGGGGSGGGGVFVAKWATFDPASGDGTLDKTWNEVYEAFKSGIVPVFDFTDDSLGVWVQTVESIGAYDGEYDISINNMSLIQMEDPDAPITITIPIGG